MGRKLVDYHMSHQQIADELGISRSMGQVIEQQAIRKLKRSGKLRAFAALINDDREDYHGEEYKSIRQKTRGS